MPEIRLVFVGHDFFGTKPNRKRAYRNAVQAGVDRANADARVKARRWRYQVVYGDTPFTHPELYRRCQKLPAAKDDYWVEIQRRITTSDCALFDLTNRRFTRSLNDNVVLEYGVALGAGVPSQIMGTNLDLILNRLSNVAGRTAREYTDDRRFSGLTELVEQALILHALT